MMGDELYFEERIIFTNGCFDLLHYGHVRFLQACKDLGGYLVVGLNSDSSVKRLKGEHRPIIPEYARKEMLMALECVDEVIVFVEDRPTELLEKLQPDIYVKSDEYENVDLPEFKIVESYGGVNVIMKPSKYMKKFKTSKIIDKIYREEFKRRNGG